MLHESPWSLSLEDKKICQHKSLFSKARSVLQVVFMLINRYLVLLSIAISRFVNSFFFYCQISKFYRRRTVDCKFTRSFRRR